MDIEKMKLQAHHLNMTPRALMERKLQLQNQAWWLESGGHLPPQKGIDEDE